MVLFLASFYEIVGQKYLIPKEFRTSFWGIDGYDWVSRRKLERTGTILAQGPYIWNHTLSGFCAAASGVFVFLIDKRKSFGVVLFYMFVFTLISTGVRAGFYAVAIGLLLYSVWAGRLLFLLHYCIAALCATLFYLLYIGRYPPVFFVGDINDTFIGNGQSAS